MHEFGLAQQIVEMAEEHARPFSSGRVIRIEVEVGELANVMIESLLFSLEAVLEGSICKGAEIQIQRIPGRGRCPQCSIEFPMAALFGHCPECGDPNPQLIQGKELRLISIEVE